MGPVFIFAFFHNVEINFESIVRSEFNGSAYTRSVSSRRWLIVDFSESELQIRA